LTRSLILRSFSGLMLLSLLLATVTAAQTSKQSATQTPAQSFSASKTGNSELRFVAIFSRHGVRSPTGKTDLLNQYSAKPWPAWSVPPGYLTAHGFELMKLVGAYDRELLVSQGLLAASGCADASHIRILADSDQRTRETGKALALGLAPGCQLDVTALPEGTEDPLFHALAAGVGKHDRDLATAAIAGRIGGNPANIAIAYQQQLAQLQQVLSGCANGGKCAENQPQKLAAMSATLTAGKGDHLADLRTPLGLASTITENFLLEYCEGLDASQIGWGQVNLDNLRTLLQLHVAQEEIAARTPYIARAQSSNTLFHMLQSLRQAAVGKPVSGAISKVDDKLLILAGHDTNIASMAGALNINWILDGRRDDTPPGGALVFELWKNAAKNELEVRLFYTAQTLDQMRNATPLTLSNSPERVSVFLPGCSRADGSCTLAEFEKAMEAAIDPNAVQR
jgi:4-phytase/acid phosphatase